MKNEKGIALTMPLKTNSNHEKTMDNTKPIQNKFQFEMAVSTEPPKKLKHNNCYECGSDTPTAGFRFRFVPICECCRIEREVEITGNRFERRHKR